jgi:HSP20 family protein
LIQAKTLEKGGIAMFTRLSDINRLFNAMDFFRNRLDSLYSDVDWAYTPGLRWSVEDRFPKTNLYEDGDLFEIRAELPGIGKEDLNVKIQGNYLEISGTRKSATPEKYSIHRTERDITSFTRSFTLPADVDSEKAKATLENGVLTLTLPKSEAAKPKQITIA